MHDRDEYVLGKVHISTEVLLKYHMYTPNSGAIKALKHFILSALNALHIAIIAFNLVAFRISSTMSHGAWNFFNTVCYLFLIVILIG